MQPKEKGRRLSIFIFLRAASVYFLLFFFNPYFSAVAVLVLTRCYLFIKYVQESIGGLVPPSKAGGACPAAAKVRDGFCASELGEGKG